MRLHLKYILLASLFIVPVSISLVYAEEDDILGDGMGDQFGHVLRKSWQETVVKLPAAPVEKNLLPIKIFEMPQYKYYIDTQSLHISANDNVARYTIIVEPPSGLRNVFFEGIRCDTKTYKMYASSLWGQPLSPIRDSQWYPIAEKGLNVYRSDLYKYFLCSQSILKGSKKEILQYIEYPPDNFIDEELE